MIDDRNLKKSEKAGDQEDGLSCSVSISVNVGCFNDPPHREGLAHFLEHMIFMGSDKYPDENAFSSHISNNGGYSNAYTENSCTNYQFKVKYSALKEALDMKSNLFTSPLLKKDAQ